MNGYDLPDATEPKPVTSRANAVAPNSTNTNRPRPPVSRPLQAYRGSQTSYNNTPPKAQPTVQKNVKKPANELGSTFTAKQFASNENGLLNDVSNKPLTTPVRSQVGLQRRTPTEQIPPSSSSVDMTSTATTNVQTSIPRSASSLSQGRKSGIPTIGKQQRPSIPTATRYVKIGEKIVSLFVLCLLCLIDECFQSSFTFIKTNNNQWILNRHEYIRLKLTKIINCMAILIC